MNCCFFSPNLLTAMAQVGRRIRCVSGVRIRSSLALVVTFPVFILDTIVKERWRSSNEANQRGVIFRTFLKTILLSKTGVRCSSKMLPGDRGRLISPQTSQRNWAFLLLLQARTIASRKSTRAGGNRVHSLQRSHALQRLGCFRIPTFDSGDVGVAGL